MNFNHFYYHHQIFETLNQIITYCYFPKLHLHLTLRQINFRLILIHLLLQNFVNLAPIKLKFSVNHRNIHLWHALLGRATIITLAWPSFVTGTVGVLDNQTVFCYFLWCRTASCKFLHRIFWTSKIGFCFCLCFQIPKIYFEHSKKRVG